MNRKTYQVFCLVALCILINYIGKLLACRLNLPIWMDMFGTVLAAYVTGSTGGALVGLFSSVAYGLTHSYTYFAYALVNVAIGIVVGFCAKKGHFESFFGIMSVSFLLTIISTTISIPLNYIFFDGAMNNVWGDGVVSLVVNVMNGSSFVAHCVGEFDVDFLDKTVSVLLLVAVVRIYRKVVKNDSVHIKRPLDGKTNGGSILIFVLMSASAIFFSSENVQAAAQKQNYNTYVQTVYDGKSGLPGGSANDIAQTNDGILWIGTYGGLYSYDGNDFTWIDEFESVKNVNALYTDEEGRLWIGTNDSGLSISIDRQIFNVITEKDGLASDSVRCVTQGSDGYYYVGTTSDLSVLSLVGGLSVKCTIPQITYASDVAADTNGNVAAVTNAGGLYIVRDMKVTDSLESYDGIKFTCVSFNDDGMLYAGTAEGKIAVYSVLDGHLEKTDELSSDILTNIKSVYFTDDGTIFVCADNGAGYIDTDRTAHFLNTNEFNNSIDHCMIDYQGNIWFTSSRLGLLNLSKSVFTETYYEAGLTETVVNTVTEWNNRLYFGTDTGLDVVDKALNNQSDDIVAAAVGGVRIRNLSVDSENNLWMGTSSKGIYCADSKGNIMHFDTDSGLNGTTYRCIIEAQDGTIVAAGNSGVSYIKNKKVTYNIGKDDGLTNSVVLCLLELDNGLILAGTDGGGIAVIDNQKVTRIIGKDDGLSSNVILRMVQGLDGIYVVTSNSICYMDEDLGNIRILDRFPYNNNYDLVRSSDGTVFVLSSAGIYVVDEEDLLSDSNDEMEYKLYDAERGFKKSLTPNSWNYIDADDNLYLSTDTGVVYMNLDRYDVVEGSYRMNIEKVIIDGVEQKVERGQSIHLERGVEKIEIVPQIINYTINTPFVSVYLEGIDDEPTIMMENELTNSVYTNLPVGTYTYRIAVLDSKGHNVVSEYSCVIIKDSEIYDHWWFYLYVIVLFAAAVAYLTWLFFRTHIQRTINVQKKELQLARDQIEMGNETVLTIARTVDAKDENTSQHSFRVSEYSVMIAQKLGFSPQECENLRKTALLHDIGKIGIPDSVLNKPGKLTDEEYSIMKSHVVKGGEILRTFKLIDNVADGALYHHERYDGKGYVHGLKGEEIPLNARIIGIADAFDAMTANRVYRKKLDIDYVIGELHRGRGTQFDPQLVDIMLELIDSKEIDMEKMYAQDDAEEQEVDSQ